MEAKRYDKLTAGANKCFKGIQMLKVAVLLLKLFSILIEVTNLKQSLQIKLQNTILINLTIQK